MQGMQEIVRNARRLGLSEVLAEVRELDALLRCRSPSAQLAMARDGHLIPIHRRLGALCRRLAFALEAERRRAVRLARWLLLHAGELAAAAAQPPTGLAARLEAVFAVDLWVGLRLGLLSYLRASMPPRRDTDLDFNENYAADRRAISLYAGGLSRIRLQLLELAGPIGCRPRLGDSLDFDPGWGLSPLSPLDRYRDRLLAALRELTCAIGPSHRSAVLSVIEASRAAMLSPAQRPDRMPRDMLAVLGALGALAEDPRSWPEPAGLLRLALAQGEKQVRLPAWDPDSRQRQQLLAALERTVAGDRPAPATLLRYRLEVLELADLAEKDESGEPRPRGGSRRAAEPGPRPRAAWLRLYCALVLMDGPLGPDVVRQGQEPAELCARLLDKVAVPPRINAPEAGAFRGALQELRGLLTREADALPDGLLRRIVGLQDVSREITYYVEDDALYDAGHDWVQADYGPLRAAACDALARRQRLPPAQE